MIRDLSNGKCSCGTFEVGSTAVSVNVPNDAKGVKIYSADENVFFNVNDDPGTQTKNSLVAGGVAVAGILETRILQDGSDRILKLQSENDCEVLIEFWG
ncbi:MAG: hypothetical protein IKO48_07210 [Elusimicrobia bacterium]|nr:hypothetical protein [Elusimicrobiota bacterium]